MGNITLILLAILCMALMAPVLYSHRDNLEEMFKNGEDIAEDERTRWISDNASTMTLGIVLAVVIWIAIVLVTLRDSFPQFTQVGYVLFAVGIFSIVIYTITNAYYRRKY